MLIALVFAAAWAAFVVSAVAGGGAGLVLVPLLRLVVPIASVPAALSIGTAASSLSRMALFRASIRWDVVRRFVPGALPAAALGAWLLTRFAPVYVELVLACFLLANLPALFRKATPVTDAPPLAMRMVMPIGAVAGLLSGFTGAVGLLFNGAYRRLGLTPRELVATRATNEVLLHLLKIALYAAFGLLDRAALAAGAVVALAAILASISMRWLLPLIREALFQRIGQLAMVAAGVAMFALSSGQIAAIHRTWLTVVSAGGEHEVQLYWQGRQRLAAEREREGPVVLERAIPFDTLPPGIARAALRWTPRAAITLVEEVRGGPQVTYEIYYVAQGARRKVELRETAGGVRTGS